MKSSAGEESDDCGHGGGVEVLTIQDYDLAVEGLWLPGKILRPPHRVGQGFQVLQAVPIGARAALFQNVRGRHMTREAMGDGTAKKSD